MIVPGSIGRLVSTDRIWRCGIVATLLIAMLETAPVSAQSANDMLRMFNNLQRSVPQYRAPRQRAPARYNREAVYRAQTMLNALGYNAGPADGAMGPRTRNALGAFQRDVGLQQTGVPNPSTLSELERALQSRSAARPGVASASAPGTPPPGGATPHDGTYQAASSTAIGVTGDIVIAAGRITFANGASIGLRSVGANLPGVFAVDPPVDPVLNHGSQLCGRDTPRFVVLAQDSPNNLYLKVFDGPDVPAPSTSVIPQPGTCALYNYVRRQETGPQNQAGPGAQRRATVREAQSLLNALGFDAGPEDGLMGRRTRAAVGEFQRNYEQRATGRLDERTLRALAGAAHSIGLETDIAVPGLAGAARAEGMTGRYQPQSPGLPTLSVDGMHDNVGEILDARIGDMSIRAGRSFHTDPGEAFVFARGSCTVWIEPTDHLGGQALHVSSIGRCLDFADLDETYVRTDGSDEEEDVRTSEAAELPSSRAEPSSQRPSGQPGTITILGLEMPEPVPFEIPVSWEWVRNDIPAELLRTPDEPLTKSEVHSQVAEVAKSVGQEFEQALDLLVNVVLAANPDWVEKNLDLFLMEWLAENGASDSAGDSSSSIELSSGIVITPEAQILVQRLEIDRLYRKRDAVEAILQSFWSEAMAEEAPASPAVTDGDEEPDAVQAETGPPADLPPAGPLSEDAAAAISENWARRSAEALGKGRKREAILNALKGLPKDVSDVQLDAEYHPAHLALYTAMRADIIRFPYGRNEFLRTPISVSPARDRLVVGAKRRDPQWEGHWFPDWIEFWDMETQEIIAEWSDASLFVDMHHFERAKFDVAGKNFSIMGDDGKAHLFDAGTGRHLGSSEPLAPPMSGVDGVIILSLDVSPSGQYVFASSRFTSGLKVWDAETMSPVLAWNADEVRRIVGGQSEYAYATGHFIDDDTLCLLAIGDRRSPAFAQGIVAGLLDVTSGRFDEIFRREQRGHTAKVECSPGKQWLALRHVGIEDVQSASFQTLEMIDMASGAVVHTINDMASVNHLSFNADERLVALYGLQGWTFYDLESGEFVREPGTPRDFQLGHVRFFDADTDDPVHSHAVQLSAFTADRVWDRVPVGSDLVAAAIEVLTDAERAEIDRERVAIAAEDDDEPSVEPLAVISENWAHRSAQLLEEGYRTEAVMAALKGLPAQPNELDLEEAFAPAHLALYTAFRSNYIRLPLAERIAFDHSRIAPDRSRALTMTQMPDGDHHIELWNGEDGVLISTLLVGATPGMFGGMAMSRDARWAAVDSLANTLRLHDAVDGRLQAEFRFPPPQHQGGFERLDMEFSPGSEYLAAVGSHPSQLKAWRLPEGEPVFTLTNADLSRMGMGGSVPSGINVAWANDTHLCGSVTNPGSNRGYSLIIVDVANGAIKNTHLLDPHLDHYQGGAGMVRCSPDLRMAAASYSSKAPNSMRYMHLLSLEGGVSKIADLDTHRIFTPVFDPSSRYIAADMDRGTPRQIYDIELGDFVEHPTVMEGFAGPWNGLFNSSEDVRLIGKSILPTVDGIWDEVPQGQALIDAALAELSYEQREDVDRMRLK